MNRLSRTLVPILALAVLMLVVAGIPAALLYFIGWPVPSPFPTGAELGDVFAGRTPVPADYLISILGVLMWFIWFQIAWATVLEVGAALRGRMAGQAPVLPGLQLGVAKLVTAATLLATSLSVKPVSAGPLVPLAAAQPMLDQAASVNRQQTIDTRREQTRATPYLTEPGDTWWGIAEDNLGSGTRWKEIRSLNLGRTMGDGSVITSATDMLKPEWRLLLPDRVSVGANAAAGLTDISTAAGSSGLTRSVMVESGDTIWGIAKEDLEDRSNGAVAEHVDVIVDLNRGRLDGNPDLIYPGQNLDLPPGEVDASPTARSTPTAPTPTPSTPTTENTPTTQAPTTEAPTTAAPTSAPTTATTAAPTSAAAAVPSTIADTAAPTSAAAAVPSTIADTAAPTSAAAAATEPATVPPSIADTAAPESSTEVTGEASGIVPATEQPPMPPKESAVPVEETSPLAGATATAEGTPVPSSAPDRDSPLSAVPSPTGEFRQDSPESENEDGGSSELGPLSPAVTAPELRTAVELTESDLVASQSPGQVEQLDSESSRAPIFLGLAALTLLGGYLYRSRGRRRETALRHRHPGRRPSPPKRRTRGVARRLSAAAEVEHPEFVNVGLRALSRQLRNVPARRLPIISGVWVSHNRLVIALADDSPRLTPPEPFTEFADGSGWSLHRNDIERARRCAKGANGPLPLLTTVGTTTALDLALTTNSRAPAEAYGLATSLLFAIDLEAGRVISVQANDEASTIEALTMMALELATSETADQAEIVCVGFGHRLATFDRVMIVEDVSEILGDLETITGRAVYAAADASPFATRVGNGAADTWNPVIVFHADGFDPHSETLIELAERTPGGVTAVCGYPTTVGWKLLVNGDRVSCPDLPGDLAGHEFKRPELDGIELIPDLFDEPWDEVELDDEFWQPMDPVEAAHTWHLLDSDETSWRPMRSVTDPERSAGPASDRDGEVSIAVVVNQTEPEPSPDPEDLWDSLATVDPDSWPDIGIPALDELQHSVEHRTVEENSLDSDVDRLFLGSLESPTDADAARGRHLYVVEPGTGDGGDDPVSPSIGGDEPAFDEPGFDDSAVDDRSGEHDPAENHDPDGSDPAEDQHRYEDGDGTADAEVTAPIEPEDLEPSASVESFKSRPVARPKFDEAAISVSVLGNFTIEGHHVGDRSKPWKYTKTPELILYLLLHPSGASQDLLMEQLFPGQPPNRPRLNQLVSDARTKALGQDPHGEYHLPHASPTEPFYKLLPTVGLDLRDFAQHCANAREANDLEVEKQEWQAALTLVRGRPFTLPHDGYEWALPEIEATIVKVEEAAVALSDIAVEAGDYELAVWATKQGLKTETGYYELLVKRGRAALLLQDPEEIVRAFADLQVSLEYTGAPEEGMPDLSSHPELEDVYNELSSDSRSKDRPT